MTSRTKVLQQLVERSLYTVDEREVAEAVLLRAAVRRTVPGFTGPEPAAPAGTPTWPAPPEVRSFRHDGRARSFRLARSRGAAHR